MNGAERLKNAVVLVAVKDWRQATRVLKKNPMNRKASRVRRECERFFRSREFGFWTETDGKMLLESLKGEIDG